MSTWKIVNTRKQKKKTTYLALSVLTLILLVLVGSWLYRFTQSLFKPQSDEMRRLTVWDGQFPLNLVVLGEGLAVFSFDPNDYSTKIITIPENLYLRVPDGFGNWQVSSIYQLGISEMKGGLLLKKSLSEFLAIPIDGFLKVDLPPKDLTLKMKNDPLFLIKRMSTDLTPAEILRLLWLVRSVRFDKQAELNLEEVLENKELPDGTQVLDGDKARIDSFMEDLIDKKMFNEQVTVAIFNGTGKPGLAQKAGRVIANMGGSVIIQGNFEKNIQKTVIVGEDSYTKKRLEGIFVLGCLDATNCDTIEGFPSRATLNLVLGEDFR